MKLIAPITALTVAAIDAHDTSSWIGATHLIHEALDTCLDGHYNTCDFPLSGRHLAETSDTIDVSSKSIAHLTKVDVTYNVAGASKDDRIAAYCTKDVNNAPDKEYIDFQLSPGIDSSKITFGPLLNMRCDYQFRYLKALGNNTFQKLAVSPVVKMEKGDTEPLQIHIALTENDDEISVMWTSDAIEKPTLLYYIMDTGAKSDKIEWRNIKADGASYTAEDMCSAPANITTALRYIPSGTHYNGIIRKIPGNAKVIYKVGNEKTGWSDEKSFVMPALAKKDPSSFFVFGDLGTWVTATNGTGIPGRSQGTINRVAEDLAKNDRNYHAVMHVGDLSYADSVGYIWEQFHSLIEPVASKIPYMVSVGNHEYCYLNSTKAVDISGETEAFYPGPKFVKASSGGECGLPTALRFNVPNNGNKVFWYSVDMGLAHHIVLSSEHDFNAGSRLRQWLEEDLASVDRSERPWIFIHNHRSMYVSMEEFFPYTDLLRPALEPLMKKYSVDAYFSGHTHAYERTCPVYNQTCQWGADNESKGTVHVMIGSAGKQIDKNDWVSTPWSVIQLKTYGYSRVHLANSTHAQVEYVVNSDGSVADSFWIKSGHKWGGSSYC